MAVLSHISDPPSGVLLKCDRPFVVVNDHPFTIVGVAPTGFVVSWLPWPELWVPLATDAPLRSH